MEKDINMKQLTQDIIDSCKFDSVRYCDNDERIYYTTFGIEFSLNIKDAIAIQRDFKERQGGGAGCEVCIS